MAPLVTNTLVRLLTSANPGEEPYSTAIDARVLLFTLGVAVVASLLFSMAPVLHFLRPDLANALRQSAGTASKNSQRFRKAAVGVQIALSVLLLGGAGLFVRTLNNLRHQQVGFDTTHLATFSFDPSDSGYGQDRMVPMLTSALDAVQHIPGVLSVAATNDAELTGDSHFSGFAVEGHKFTEEEKTDFEAPWVTSGYFATIKQPLLVGREFTAADSHDAPKVAVVNLTFAKRFFGSAQNALGHMVSEGGDNPTPPDTTIVGVVGDIKHANLRTDMGMAVYRPYPQNPHPTSVRIYARTTQSPDMIETPIRSTIHGIDPTLVVAEMRTMDEQVDRSAADEQALALLAVGFSALAIVLAAVGLYGVLAYSTEQRTREIGVRLALGSQRSGVVMLIVREMFLIAAIAIVLALPATVLLARLFRSQLYGVTASDPLTLAGAVLLAAIMVTLAAVLPARRAASIEPMQALRTE